MIPIHLYSTGETFIDTVYETDFKTSKRKARKEASMKDISNWMINRYIHCATDIDHNKYAYIKTVKFLNQHINMVCNICVYHVCATLKVH